MDGKYTFDEFCDNLDNGYQPKMFAFHSKVETFNLFY